MVALWRGATAQDGTSLRKVEAHLLQLAGSSFPRIHGPSASTHSGTFDLVSAPFENKVQPVCKTVIMVYMP